MSSLAELKKKRDKLLEKSQSRSIKINKKHQEALEKKKVLSEIKALENPKSTHAKKRFLSIAKKVGKGIITGARKFDENLNRMEENQRRENAQNQRKKSVKSSKRRPTIRRRIKRSR